MLWNGLLSTGHLSTIGTLLLPVMSMCIYKTLLFLSWASSRLYSLYGHVRFVMHFALSFSSTKTLLSCKITCNPIFLKHFFWMKNFIQLFIEYKTKMLPLNTWYGTWGEQMPYYYMKLILYPRYILFSGEWLYIIPAKSLKLQDNRNIKIYWTFTRLS